MRFTNVASVLGATVLLGSPLAAQANPCTDTQASTATCYVETTLSATVPTVVRLTLTGFTLDNNTDFGTITEGDFNTGYKDVAGPKSNVKANKAWTLTVASTGATFTGATYAKPVGDLLWKEGLGGDPATPMSTTAAELADGGPTDSQDHDIQYRLNLTYALDAPGTYNLTVHFTLSAP
jgi:hypothetical protein